MIWDRLILNSAEIIRKLNYWCTEYEEPGMERFNRNGWTNRTWHSQYIRRAHVDIVDVRETKKLWMMHVCIFPDLQNGGPIFGWDVIAGEKKITGAFHDFSPLLKKDSPLVDAFGKRVENFKPSKQRDLPDWAMKIFSPHMIAAGNVTEEQELNSLCHLVENNLTFYLDQIVETHMDSKEPDVVEAQNYYCKHQQMNPHTPRVMERLGLPEEDVKLFCADNLFPTIN